MAYLTEQEQIDQLELCTMQLESRLMKGEDISIVGPRIPFAIQLVDPATFKMVDANKMVAEYTGFTVEEAEQNWNRYMKIVHPETVKSMKAFLPEFYGSHPAARTLSFIQYVKLRGSRTFSPIITVTKPSRLPNGQIIWLSVLPDYFGEQSGQIERIVRMDEFKVKHFRQFQQLTDREVEVLRLLANGRNNPQIAEELFLSRSTVETHRKNLKRKLEIKSFADLMRYAFSFELVEL